MHISAGSAAHCTAAPADSATPTAPTTSTPAPVKQILPGQTIGIIGGGQLGQMLAQSAKEMGYVVGVLDPLENCSAAQVCDFHFQNEFTDITALRAFAQRCDVVTFEFENVDTQVLNTLQAEGALYLPQGTELLRASQNRLDERQFLLDAHTKVAPHARVATKNDLLAGIEQLGMPCVLKTSRFGYDGKGQVVIRSKDDLNAAYALIEQQVCLLEAWIDFACEVSVMVCGDMYGTLALFEPSENIHEHNILHASLIPARIPADVRERALAEARKIAQAAHLVGDLGVEMFVLHDGSIMINELAPRPHNSGHYTIEACDFSQFDLHIRAVCGLHVAQPHLLSPAVMMNVLGQHVEGTYRSMPHHETWHYHLYGKGEARYARKMGHITALCDNPAQQLCAFEESGIWTANTTRKD